MSLAAVERFKRDRGNVEVELRLVQVGLVKPEKPAEAVADLRRRLAELNAIMANV